MLNLSLKYSPLFTFSPWFEVARLLIFPLQNVKSFRTAAEVDEWLYANPMRSPGALHFAEINATVISYGLQTNSTPLAKRGYFEQPTLKFQIPLQIAAEREIARSLIGVPNFSWVVALKEFAHPKVEITSAITVLGPPFFLATAIFGFVFQMSSLVAEKELKLRQGMNMMGLYESAYWLSWFTWEGILTLLSSLFTVLFGMLFQFDLFLNNSSAVVFLVFFLFQLNMLAFGFMLSAFMSKSSSSSTIGFSIFIIGSMTELVGTLNFSYSHRFSKRFRTGWSFFPPNLLTKALWLLSDATSSPQDVGISWSRMSECASNDAECLITISEIFRWFVATFFLWSVLAIYLDNILPDEYGVRKSMFYFLNFRYWTGRAGNKDQDGAICSCIEELNPPEDEDVLEEENIIKRQIKEGIDDTKITVQIRGLVKIHPASTNIGCFKCKKIPPFHALKGLWLNIARDQLFCLLGTSGAGKTSLIYCLTGITPVTGGDALISGNSIRSSVDISRIRKLIGVCPQFDILWDALSGQEHLQLFASIKGLHQASIQSVVQKSLEEVRLTEAAKKQAGSYSGGMRRRLSLAIALIGDPKLLILDEPTTGTDPITRRHVWDIILKAKRGRAIVLTTHSMEEADILGDRIGIMANGKLQCIGNSSRLKTRFGTGFVVHVSFVKSSNGHTHEDVKQFFKTHLDVVPKEENKSFLTFAIPRNREVLFPDCFAEVQNRESEFGISDIQISFTSLEEVFLSIARRAELENAIAEGKFVTLNLSSGMSIEVPLGATLVGIPGTETEENPRGKMVEVHWKQDDLGALCISGHSAEMPIPPDVEPIASLAVTSRKNFTGS
ncbi:ABC transporter A family member 2 [Morus notabilis]|uniref:ABC transporter A family member 2 n=1 Tax=Morus notabilis TaxID=981085 RepID=UPI000CED5ED8|nr:ABC transporter A family member 2 [Morus notabilis]